MEEYRKFTWFYVRIYVLWVVLFLYMICVDINTNPPFENISTVSVSEIDNVIKFALITAAKESVTSKVSISSVRVPSLPIWWRHLNFFPICAIMLCRF